MQCPVCQAGMSSGVLNFRATRWSWLDLSIDGSTIQRAGFRPRAARDQEKIAPGQKATERSEDEVQPRISRMARIWRQSAVQFFLLRSLSGFDEDSPVTPDQFAWLLRESVELESLVGERTAGGTL